MKTLSSNSTNAASDTHSSQREFHDFYRRLRGKFTPRGVFNMHLVQASA